MLTRNTRLTPERDEFIEKVVKVARPIDSEIAKFLPPAESFDVWWGAAEFAAAVDAHKQTVPVVEFMCRPQLKPLREAWAAARFATIRSQDHPVSIRLERDRFPDFHLRVRNETQCFELVEADHPGRRRGDEYRAAAVREIAALPPEIEHFSPDEEMRVAIPAIARAIGDKASKGYRPVPHLLVYVNFPLFCDPPITSLHAFALADKYSASFASAWLLWGRFAVRLWPRPAMIRDQTRPGA